MLEKNCDNHQEENESNTSCECSANNCCNNDIINSSDVQHGCSEHKLLSSNDVAPSSSSTEPTKETTPKFVNPIKKRNKKEKQAEMLLNKENPGIKGRRGVGVNKQTFMENTHKQFKINLNERIRKGDCVLVCFSGGLSSTAMICMLNQCVSPNPNWKLHFKWEYLFVDISGALGMSDEERMKLHEQISTVCSNTNEHNRTLHIRSIEDMLFDGSVEKMKNFIFKQFKTMSVHEDLLNQMVKTCIYKFAVEKNFKQVLTGENANRLAIGVLSEISKGRGYTIPLHIQLEDSSMNGIPTFNPSTDSPITFIRPMKTFLANELAIYIYWFKMNHHLFVNDITTKVGVRQSTIYRLVEDFVSMLQKDYPSTVHAILRTIEKLKTPEQTSIKCALCGVFLSEEDLQDLKTSLERSHESDYGMAENQPRHDTSVSLSQCCCFGCKRVLSYCTTENRESTTNIAITDLTSEVYIDETFPEYIQQGYQTTRNEMRKQISEFLLEDQEDE
ncbi:hypothetical protein FDP41_007818 [Naegleria fowleri]|uniref:Cytoplasmic tRNA 2-thiolation protein 2 n=1 Tax=Naegleria fowleri TaxID=5763 RepID=A0A6A5C0E3_NAEFO|nr:uncharacterized protein FDP41_007818 [Naegleria fowleri]KAF0983903.1 hypothetical protein FDP41_007818 [Naegleria fowleri]CAG4709003.1 unnamed protein product [Naegleria fowleri]